MYSLSIVTPERSVFEGEVQSLIAPGTIGYLEILTNHAPIITSLKAGKLTVTDMNNKKMIWALSGGYLEMSHNKATILADAVELASEIDVKRAELALARARKIIASQDTADIPRAKKAILRAENRLKIAHEQF